MCAGNDHCEDLTHVPVSAAAALRAGRHGWHRHGDAHDGAGSRGSGRLVRFHELLKQCLTMCDEARALVELPPAAAADVSGGSSETTRQYFLSQFGSMAPDKWLEFFRTVSK